MVSMALVACGGGGGADDNVTPPPAPPGNVAPVAQAGPNQSVRVRSTVTLDGSKSTDADGDKLTYHWTLARPDGKSGTLEAADSAQPRFIAAELGNYVATLVVNDGHVNSAPASTIVTASSANAAPVANPGGAQSVKTGDTVQLDGTASSDADGDALTYRWSLATPEGSRATLDKPDAAQPAFKPDVPGTYVASLIVNDGFDRESADRVLGAGQAAAVSFGRSYIGNPDLVRRLREGLPLADFDLATLYTPGPKGYTDYTAAS